MDLDKLRERENQALDFPVNVASGEHIEEFTVGSQGRITLGKSFEGKRVVIAVLAVEDEEESEGDDE